jgi:uncharacterized membrane protein
VLKAALITTPVDTCSGGPSSGGASSRLTKNIEALVERRRREDLQRPPKERIADEITRFAGSLTFVVIHALVFGLWIVLNLGLIRGFFVFDRGFAILAVVAAIEAIFLSTFVLISQNSMQTRQERRAELDLQINLLAEHELTQVVHLLDAVARKVGVDAHAARDIEEAKQQVEPEVVLEAIEEQVHA